MKKNITTIETLQAPETRANQITAWKAEHGEIFYFKLGNNKECFLKKPDLKIISYAAQAAQADPMNYNKVILAECWLAGHEEIKTEPGLFLSISQKIEGMVGIVEVEMVKL